MIINEDKLNFEFDENEFKAIKFDEIDFYKEQFQFPGSKGIDILAKSKDDLLFIEIKDCLGYESDNICRTATDNNKMIQGESFDVEVSKKVAMTVSCLVGAHTKLELCKSAQELKEYTELLISKKMRGKYKRIFVILFLEGNFKADSRAKKSMMYKLSQSIKEKLKWLECKVLVVDMNTYRKKFFTVKRI